MRIIYTETHLQHTVVTGGKGKFLMTRIIYHSWAGQERCLLLAEDFFYNKQLGMQTGDIYGR